MDETTPMMQSDPPPRRFYPMAQVWARTGRVVQIRLLADPSPAMHDGWVWIPASTAANLRGMTEAMIRRLIMDAQRIATVRNKPVGPRISSMTAGPLAASAPVQPESLQSVEDVINAAWAWPGNMGARL